MFSIEGMAQNMYLPSIMDDDGFISIHSLVWNFSMNGFPVSIEDVIEVANSSDIMVVDETSTKIRPNIDVERKTIILRDLDNVTEEEVRSIFADIAPVESVKPPVGDNWFIVLDSEESAVNALRKIQNKPFKDTVLHARIKNESRAMVINKMISSFSSSMPFSSFNPNASSVFSSASMTYAASADNDHYITKGSNRRGRGGKSGSRRRNPPAPKPIPLPQLSSSSAFPPLVFTGGAPVGYQGPYVKYAPDEIKDIVSKMTDLSIPAVPEGDCSAVLTSTPNAELVAKQRTQSIDMSLGSGAPRTYSVDSVDYTTMLMGDVDEEVKEEARRRRRNHKPRKL